MSQNISIPSPTTTFYIVNVIFSTLLFAVWYVVYIVNKTKQNSCTSGLKAFISFDLQSILIIIAQWHLQWMLCLLLLREVVEVQCTPSSSPLLSLGDWIFMQWEHYRFYDLLAVKRDFVERWHCNIVWVNGNTFISTIKRKIKY